MTEGQKQANRILYLRWLMTNHQQVYKDTVLPAVMNHFQKKPLALQGLDTEVVEPWQKTGNNSVGGFWDQPITVDTAFNSSAPPSINYDFTPDSNSGGLSSILSSVANGASNIFQGIVNAAPVIGQAYVATKSQLNLLQVNSDRAKQGLPPLSNVNGTLVTASQLSVPNANTAALEGAITAGGMSSSTMLLWGVGLGLGILLISKLAGSHK